MESILDTLMAAARAEARTAPGVCNAADAAHSAIESVADQAATSGIVVTVQAQHPVQAGADAEVVERVLVPLLENAVRFARTEVKLGIRRGPSLVIIDVRDDGEGIPSDRLESVFDPGATFTTPDVDHDGAGLGLPLARRLARTAGGDVQALTRTGGGHLQVTLPAV